MAKGGGYGGSRGYSSFWMSVSPQINAVAIRPRDSNQFPDAYPVAEAESIFISHEDK